MRVTATVRLVRPLGRGGMGAVWVAEHTALKTEVVVKFMSETLTTDPVSLARFSKEASAAAAVKSPHVVQMLDHGFTQEGTPFIVMELLDGEDLKEKLAREHTVPLPELAHILSQACKALGRAHASGIIHRDIKPENIFLCRTDDAEPFVKLLDFGIAKSGNPSDFHMTQTGVAVGTPYYMSPEQAVGAPPVDPRTDLWSLGVVAFEALTGTRPFDGATLGALTIAICNERPPLPSSVNPRLPKSIDEWMARACAREGKDRFPTARAMSDAFAAAIGRAPSVSAPPPVPLALQATSFHPSATPAPTPPAVLRKDFTSTMEVESADFTTTTVPLSRTNEAPTLPLPVSSPATPSRRYSTSASVLIVAGAATVAALGVAIFVGTRSPEGVSTPQDVQEIRGSAPPVPAAHVAGETAIPAVAASSLPLVPSAIPARSAAPAPSVSAPPHGAPPPRPSSTAHTVASSCDPPYFFDSSHTKIFKPECL